jgi:hypothetical protein
MDRVAWALEAYRLALRDEEYPPDLEELVDLGLIRSEDLVSPAGDVMRYERTGEDGWTLEFVSADETPVPDLYRAGGTARAALEADVPIEDGSAEDASGDGP